MKNEGELYVGTYRKYNNRSIEGKWLCLKDYPDAVTFFEACKELHSDESYPEYMFQDFEGFPKEFYTESMGVIEIQAIYDFFETYKEFELDALSIFISQNSIENLESFSKAYMGVWKSEKDFCSELFDSTYSLPAYLSPLINYDRFTSDTMINYTFEDGHIFLRNF